MNNGLIGSLIDWLEGLPNDLEEKAQALSYAKQLTDMQADERYAVDFNDHINAMKEASK